jgi:DNA-binding NarL/FixJ family response regulator
MKLLIVDDHAGVRALIRQLATPFAGEIRECASGIEAVHIAQTFRPDLITMDIRLGDMDGIEATAVLHAQCPTARVIIVTSYDQTALRRAAASAGAIHFVAKDRMFELPSLLQQLRTNLDAASAPKSEE